MCVGATPLPLPRHYVGQEEAPRRYSASGGECTAARAHSVDASAAFTKPSKLASQFHTLRKLIMNEA